MQICRIQTGSGETFAQWLPDQQSFRTFEFDGGFESWREKRFPLEDLKFGRELDEASATLLCPLPNTRKIICVGKNYADHAAEMGGETPELPVIFSKFSSCLNGPDRPVEIPDISREVDFEAELVVVIGKPGRHISPPNALAHVMGYTCGNDVTARDWQKGRPGGQWLLGKSFDTFAPIGPTIVTADEIPDPQCLDIIMRLNGQVVQSSNTSMMIYRIDFLLAHLSRFFELQPGDLVFTGTPAGVGAGRTPPLWLKPGDQCEVEIQGIGKLKNHFVETSP